MLCIATCSFTCPSSTARARGCFKWRLQSVAYSVATVATSLIEKAIDLRLHDKPPYPDGKYLIKGGGRKVWKKFGLRKEHRRLQGIINGKRCGTTQNIGPAARLQALIEQGNNRTA